MPYVNDVDLQKLLERPIIGFAYDTGKRTFTIVSDFPDLSPGSVRDLIALVFNGVRQFVREPGNLPKLARFRLRYTAKNDVGAFVFQDIETREHGPDAKYVRFWFGPNFGGMAFEYENLDVHKRGSRVFQMGDDFVYFDASTNEEFDFYFPFPSLLDERSSKN
jgi:hypothetical protein